MLIGIMGEKDQGDLDFSFVKDEIKNLKDMPRDFDDRLFEKLGVSRTVITYWREIGYVPPFYYQFWLLYQKKYSLRFEEYRKLRDMLIPEICRENEKIGEALKGYAENEDASWREFMKADGKHIFYLADEYEDGSGSILKASVDFGEVINRMVEEAAENIESQDQVEYIVSKYPFILSDDSHVIGIDVERDCGRMQFNPEAQLRYMEGVEGYEYGGMSAVPLLEPYLWIPHPFKKGDIAKYYNGRQGQYVYGVFSYAADVDEREGDQAAFHKDSSDFSTTFEVVYEKKDENRYVFGHEHICPIYMDAVDETEKLDDNFRELLLIASRIVKGKSVSLCSLSYSMG